MATLNSEVLMKVTQKFKPELDQGCNLLQGHPRYQWLEDLGKGSQGSVVLVLDKYTHGKVAIKFLPRGIEDIEKVKRELLNHRRFWHAHVIQFYEVFLVEKHVCIVMEYAPGGNLAHFIAKNVLTEDGARFFFQQLVFAVKYCHHMGVANRDIKLENTLLSDPEEGILKLCDFGLSKDETSFCKTRVGSPNYLAPEILTMPKEGTYDGKQSDVWSCGVMLYAMLCRAFPFEIRIEPGMAHDKAMLKLMERIVKGEWTIPENVKLSPSCISLLQGILKRDPSERMTLDEIQAHPWYQVGLPEGADKCDYPVRPEAGLQTVQSIVEIIDEASRVV